MEGGVMCVCVCDLNSVVFCLPTVLHQWWSHCGGPLSPPCGPLCSVSLSLSACSSSSLQQWPSACRKCDISVAQPAEYGQRTNLYCPVTHLEFADFSHTYTKSRFSQPMNIPCLTEKMSPHYLWFFINAVCGFSVCVCVREREWVSVCVFSLRLSSVFVHLIHYVFWS